ncbi:hypothetical protein LCGC14_2267220, partial [marine sediment metagenome]
MDRPHDFTPSPTELLARARSDLRMGLPIVVTRGDDRALVVAAETVGPERLAAFVAGGDADLAITHRRAETLKVRAYDGDLARLALPRDITPAGLTAIIDPAG